MGKACSGGFLSQCLENHLSISVSASLFIAEDAKLKSITSFPFGQLIKDFNHICLISKLPLDLMFF